MERMIITVDGPAGSGKSSVARLLARRLGVDFLDTGAMYRGLTAICLDEGVDPAFEHDQAVELARRAELVFDWSHDPPRLLSHRRDLTGRLRDADVTSAVSQLAAIGGVREVLVEAQRRVAREHPRLVTEGRDQGSVVFPDATIKFYLDATPPVRARRRAQQLRQAGQPVDEDRLLQEILDRDRRDSSRSDGPLICPADATRIDTTEMSMGGVVDRLESEVRARLQPRPGSGAQRGGAEHG